MGLPFWVGVEMRTGWDLSTITTSSGHLRYPTNSSDREGEGSFPCGKGGPKCDVSPFKYWAAREQQQNPGPGTARVKLTLRGDAGANTVMRLCFYWGVHECSRGLHAKKPPGEPCTAQESGWIPKNQGWQGKYTRWA